jgi:hypothetical protein
VSNRPVGYVPRNTVTKYRLDHNPLRGERAAAIRRIEADFGRSVLTTEAPARCCARCTTRPFGSSCGNAACACHR